MEMQGFSRLLVMKKIFLLDDDPFVTTLYKVRLQHEGFQVGTSNDSRDALGKIEPFLPDLRVLDLHMPQVSGADIRRRGARLGAGSEKPAGRSGLNPGFPIVGTFDSGFFQTLEKQINPLHRLH
jgi:CheY-like chemotaxis protein